MSTGKRARLELAAASDWGGPAALYRVRLDRRWLDLPKDEGGGPRFMSLSDAGRLAAAMALGLEEKLPAKPDLPRGSRVSVLNGKSFAGVQLREPTYTITEPIRAFDGRWYVPVLVVGQGRIMVAVEDLIVKERAESAGEEQS